MDSAVSLTLEQVLVLSIQNTQWEQTTKLIEQGADINLVDDSGDAPLHAALSHPGAPLDVIKQLAPSVNINMTNSAGLSPLHLAIKAERFDIIAELVNLGADVNVRNAGNKTPLHCVLSHQNAPLSVMGLLISKKNVNYTTKQKMGSRISTPLSIAVKYARWEVVSTLIGSGANLIDAYSKKLPLFEAVNHQDIPVDIIELLVPTSDHINDQRFDLSSFVYGLGREWQYRWHVFSLLLNRSFNVNFTDYMSRTLLHWMAFDKPPLDLYIRLISDRNINMRDEFGSTPLQLVLHGASWACMKGRLTALVDRGATLSIADILSVIYEMYINGTDLVSSFLQWCPFMPQNASHLEFSFAEKPYPHSLKINSEQCMIPQNMTWSYTVDVFSLLVPEICIINPQSYKDKVEPKPNSAIVMYIEDKHHQFGVIIHRVVSLQKLCVWRIRQCLQGMSDEHYARLGLPRRLLSRVTMSDVAERVEEMWKLCREDVEENWEDSYDEDEDDCLS